MLLTSSQVSVLTSTAIIILFTSALFLAGYVLQQQTLHSLQAEIKPRVARLQSRASTKSSTSKSHVFGPPAPPVTHAAPLEVPYPDRPSHTTTARAAVTRTPAQVRNTDSSLGADKDAERREDYKSEWKSREKFDEEENLSRGQERFEKEGDDFFSAAKAAEQVVVGGGRRTDLRDGKKGYLRR